MIPSTVGEALRAARERIDATDARVLLSGLTGCGHAYLAAHPEAQLAPADATRYVQVVDRRAAGEPVAYLTGRREFYGRTFRVTPAVLIPRPETELLVELALERLPAEAGARVLDLGTGSGCIAVTIASERSRCDVIAVDRSLGALCIARRNAFDHGASNVFCRHGDWFTALADGELFDMIVSNPPYVPSADAHLRQGDLRFEPRAALEGGCDGFAAIRTIVAKARRYLKPGGWLLFEHGCSQAAEARNLLTQAGYGNILCARDLAGLDRVTGARLTVLEGAR
jgi:release factor glutamine methyltransferase